MRAVTSLPADLHQRHRDRQVEAHRAGAAGVDVEHAAASLDLRAVRMARDDHVDAGRAGIDRQARPGRAARAAVTSPKRSHSASADAPGSRARSHWHAAHGRDRRDGGQAAPARPRRCRRRGRCSRCRAARRRTSGRSRPWVSEISPIRIMAGQSIGVPADGPRSAGVARDALCHSCAARRKVSITGRASTSCRLHQPAASASAAPLAAPPAGTHHGGFQWNAKT